MLARVWAARGPLGARLVWWLGLAVSVYWQLSAVAQFGVFVVLVGYAARRHWLRGVAR